MRISERLAGSKASASIVAQQRVRDLRAQGIQISDFTVGEPDFKTPDHIVEAAIVAMRAGDTHYVSSAGTKDLKDAIVRKMLRVNGVTTKAENVVVGSGAKQLIFNAFAATLEAGDEVIVPAPYWVSYPDMVRMNGGIPVIVNPKPGRDFKLNADDLAAAITPRTRWLALNSPHNPTGAIYTGAELAAVADVLRKHPHVCVITDDIYEHIVYDVCVVPHILKVAPDLVDRTLVINGVSKAYAMTGWRVGYAVGPKNLIDAITVLVGQTTTCASSISQAASVAALDGPKDFINETVQIYRSRRDRMHYLLNEIPGVECSLPQGAFYLFPSVEGVIGKRTIDGKVLHNDSDIAQYLLEQAHVAVVDGGSYGLSPYLRFSFATSMEVIEQGCESVKDAFSQLL